MQPKVSIVLNVFFKGNYLKSTSLEGWVAKCALITSRQTDQTATFKSGLYRVLNGQIATSRKEKEEKEKKSLAQLIENQTFFLADH